MANDLHTHRSEQLLKVCRTLNARLEPQIVLREVIHAAMGLADSEAASILLHDEQTHQLHLAAIEPATGENCRFTPMSPEESIAGKAFSQRAPQIVNDLSATPALKRQSNATACHADRNLIAVPLLLEDATLGVLEVCDKRHGAFQQEDVKFLSILASHAAIALQNARLKEAVRLARKEILYIKRMKSDFIAIASHELRTPLGIILGYATHLQEHADESLKQPLNAIVRAAEKLKELVEELSHLENYQQGTSVLHLTPVHLQNLLTDLVARLQPQARASDLSLVLEMPSEPIVVNADKEKVIIILRHLLHNAFTFTDPGGHIAIRLAQQSEYTQIIVKDTGIGIPADDLPHVFERFYQVEKHLTRRHGGLGLGLTIAKNMATAHGGILLIESQEGRGTTATFLLPHTPQKTSVLHHPQT